MNNTIDYILWRLRSNEIDLAKTIKAQKRSNLLLLSFAIVATCVCVSAQDNVNTIQNKQIRSLKKEIEELKGAKKGE